MQSIDLLKKLGLDVIPPTEKFGRPGVKLESYAGMGHSSCPEELQDLTAWLEAALK